MEMGLQTLNLRTEPAFLDETFEHYDVALPYQRNYTKLEIAKRIPKENRLSYHKCRFGEIRDNTVIISKSNIESLSLMIDKQEQIVETNGIAYLQHYISHTYDRKVKVKFTPITDLVFCGGLQKEVWFEPVVNFEFGNQPMYWNNIRKKEIGAVDAKFYRVLDYFYSKDEEVHFVCYEVSLGEIEHHFLELEQYYQR